MLGIALVGLGSTCLNCWNALRRGFQRQNQAELVPRGEVQARPEPEANLSQNAQLHQQFGLNRQVEHPVFPPVISLPPPEVKADFIQVNQEDRLEQVRARSQFSMR